MLVRSKSWGVVEVVDYVGRGMILRGEATAYPETEQAILHAEEQGGPAACIGVEMAVCEPRAERAVLKYVRMPRSKE